MYQPVLSLSSSNPSQYIYSNMYYKLTVCICLCRTGSKLGISPLMLAAMNGHTSAVKLLLDTGADINAQVHTSNM